MVQVLKKLGVVHSVWCVVAIGTLLCGCDGSAQLEARQLTGGDPRRGAARIESYGCGACHTIPGIQTARSNVGPPLSGFSGRTYIAGNLPNTGEHLVLWIRHPQQVNPGTAMPELGVSEADARDIAAYLYEH
jgi:cytochrome c2